MPEFRFGGMLERHTRLDLIATCPPIVLEVLQGMREHRQYRDAQTMFSGMPVLEDPMPLEVFMEAAQMYRVICSNGFTIRSSVDCLIAACAIRNDVPLLHADRDFDVIARFTLLQAKNVLS